MSNAESATSIVLIIQRAGVGGIVEVVRRSPNEYQHGRLPGNLVIGARADVKPLWRVSRMSCKTLHDWLCQKRGPACQSQLSHRLVVVPVLMAVTL